MSGKNGDESGTKNINRKFKHMTSIHDIAISKENDTKIQPIRKQIANLLPKIDILIQKHGHTSTCLLKKYKKAMHKVKENMDLAYDRHILTFRFI